MRIKVLDVQTEEEMVELIYYASDSLKEAKAGDGTCCHAACINNTTSFITKADYPMLSNGHYWAKNDMQCWICHKSMRYCNVPDPTTKRTLTLKVL